MHILSAWQRLAALPVFSPRRPQWRKTSKLICQRISNRGGHFCSRRNVSRDRRYRWPRLGRMSRTGWFARTRITRELCSALGITPAHRRSRRLLWGVPFNFGPVNTVNCGPSAGVNCVPDMIALPSSAVTITLPAPQQNIYSTMVMLGNAVQGSQPGTVIVTYTDGSTSMFNQTFSDWCSFGGNQYESIAVGPIAQMRINSDGSAGSCDGNLYAYTYPLNFANPVQSITLSNPSASGFSFVWAITMKPPSYTLTGGAATPPSISAGGTSTATVTVAPQSGYEGTVALNCVVAPNIIATSSAMPPTCIANPTSVTFMQGVSTPQTTQLTFTTVAAAKAMAQPPRTIFYALWLPVPGLALIGFGLGSGNKRRKKLFGAVPARHAAGGINCHAGMREHGSPGERGNSSGAVLPHG